MKRSKFEFYLKQSETASQISLLYLVQKGGLPKTYGIQRLWPYQDWQMNIS